jgi:hypothetical protein
MQPVEGPEPSHEGSQDDPSNGQRCVAGTAIDHDGQWAISADSGTPPGRDRASTDHHDRCGAPSRSRWASCGGCSRGRRRLKRGRWWGATTASEALRVVAPGDTHGMAWNRAVGAAKGLAVRLRPRPRLHRTDCVSGGCSNASCTPPCTRGRAPRNLTLGHKATAGLCLGSSYGQGPSRKCSRNLQHRTADAARYGAKRKGPAASRRGIGNGAPLMRYLYRCPARRTLSTVESPTICGA